MHNTHTHTRCQSNGYALLVNTPLIWWFFSADEYYTGGVRDEQLHEVNTGTSEYCQMGVIDVLILFGKWVNVLWMGLAVGKWGYCMSHVYGIVNAPPPLPPLLTPTMRLRSPTYIFRNKNLARVVCQLERNIRWYVSRLERFVILRTFFVYVRKRSYKTDEQSQKGPSLSWIPSVSYQHILTGCNEYRNNICSHDHALSRCCTVLLTVFDLREMGRLHVLCCAVLQ